MKRKRKAPPFDPKKQCAICLGPDPIPKSQCHANPGEGQPHRIGGYCMKCRGIFMVLKRAYSKKVVMHK